MTGFFSGALARTHAGSASLAIPAPIRGGRAWESGTGRILLPRVRDAVEVFFSANEETVGDWHRRRNHRLAHFVFGEHFEFAFDAGDEDDAVLAGRVDLAVGDGRGRIVARAAFREFTGPD